MRNCISAFIVLVIILTLSGTSESRVTLKKKHKGHGQQWPCGSATIAGEQVRLPCHVTVKVPD